MVAHDPNSNARPYLRQHLFIGGLRPFLPVSIYTYRWHVAVGVWVPPPTRKCTESLLVDYCYVSCFFNKPLFFFKYTTTLETTRFSHRLNLPRRPRAPWRERAICKYAPPLIETAGGRQ